MQREAEGDREILGDTDGDLLKSYLVVSDASNTAAAASAKAEIGVQHLTVSIGRRHKAVDASTDHLTTLSTLHVHPTIEQASASSSQQPMTRWIGLTLLQGTMTEARKRHTRTRSDRSGTDGRRWRAVCYQLSQMVLTMIFVVLLTSGGLNFLNGLTVSTQGTCTHLRISDNIVK